MSLFIVLPLLMGAAWAFFRKFDMKKEEKIVYGFFVTFLCALCAFRYCQGSDYISYKYTALSCSTIEKALANPNRVNSQIGFRILCGLFGGKYELMIACIAVYSILMMTKGIDRYSPDRFLSLLLAYPTIYLTYQFSGIRQGIVISTFFGVLLPWIEEKKWGRYCAVVCLLATIHTVALLYFVIPLIIRFKNVILLLPAITFGIGIAFMLLGGGLLGRIPVIGNSLAHYSRDSVSVFALAERIVSYLVVLLLFADKRGMDTRTENMLKIYMLGTAIYMAAFPFALIASRTCILFKCVEIFLVPILLQGKEKKMKKMGQIGAAFFLALTMVMTVKNIGSYLQQLSYKNTVTVWNYPYISIFDKQKLTEYQNFDPRFLDIY